MIDIEKIIRSHEHSRLEAKKALGGIPNSVWESYSAFANTEGGIILLGVSEVDSKLVVTGVKEAQKKLKSIWDVLNDRSKISNNVLLEKHLYIQQVSGYEVIVMDVPRADRHDKPVYINNNLFDGTFRRNAEGDYHCSQQEVKAMLRDQSDLPIDSSVIYELSWQDLDSDCISRYRNRFASFKPAHVWNGLDTIEFLSKTGSVRKNENGVFCPTLAGLLMFGTDDIITRILPDYFLDYREKYDDNRWSDRVVSNSGDWSGNIFDFFFKIIDRLTADIKRPFRMRNSIERDDDTAVNVAVREALANSVIHADYYGRQGIVVEKRKNEISFSNPGGCRLSVKEAMEGGISDPRNPTIFKLFSLIEIGERAGSGIFNICSVWNRIEWKIPSLHQYFSPDRTTFILPIELEHEDLSNRVTVNEDSRKKVTVNAPNRVTVNEDSDKKVTVNAAERVTVNEDSGKKVTVNTPDRVTENKDSGKKVTENTADRVTGNSDNEFTVNQKIIIDNIIKNPQIAAKELSSIIGISERKIKDNIAKLKSKGILDRIGPDKGGYWRVNR